MLIFKSITILGLKPFSGSKFPDLFVPKQTEDNNIDKEVETKMITNDDSDSDSDYEYFKVQKDLAVKEAAEKTKECDEDKIIEASPGNRFDDALKSALIDDELILPATVNQTFLVVPMKLRLVTLCSLIVEHCVLNKKGGKMIVFMATLEMVDYHSDLIETVLTGKDSTKSEKEKKKRVNKKSDEEVIIRIV